MATSPPETIRVLAFRDGDAWVAQCLEYDICAQGDDFGTAMKRLTVTVNAEVTYTETEYGSPFANIAPAPAHFKERFEAQEQSLFRDNMEWRLAA